MLRHDLFINYALWLCASFRIQAFNTSNYKWSTKCL